MITFNELMRHLLLLPQQGSELAHDIDQLHYFVILTTFAGSFLVFATAGVFFIRYRRKSEDQTTLRIQASRAVEAAYILGPLALFLLWFFMGFVRFMQLQTPPPNAMDVYVTAKQWMWKFTYPEGPNAIGILRVPANKPVRLLLTSRDVIHSLFVPEFRIKKDAVPGRYTEVWFEASRTGRYRIFCAEYCGLLHSQMLGEVHVLEPGDYARWLDEQRQGLEERRDASASATESSLQRGRAISGPAEAAPGPLAPRSEPAGDLASQGALVAARAGCLGCHSVNGQPDIGPTWLDLYMRREPLSEGASAAADEAYLTESMMDPEAKIVAGFQPVMPSFQGQLSAAEAAALVEYIKSLRTERPGAVRAGEPAYEPVR